MGIPSYGTDPAAGEYSVDKENQLEPEDTLIERGIDDMLDEGYSNRPNCSGVARSACLKAWTRCSPRKSRIRHRGSMAARQSRAATLR
jgi:hypothetical protein